ncbi:MAG: hypothetical protein AVDCRST_MAG19-2195 [uncultured Thermomicrobiales bacterium]|uniref:Uncharacterized protein n=1 Tax=uncultured Thermomicrobiales bacterium TaxID=1645740 RepID=A0A6J4V0T8_9BACT|nr:MAG: hypothetical protein AVDCRST_MAG19-2195 [uncultured Thermomicrobiales bacterium]
MSWPGGFAQCRTGRPTPRRRPGTLLRSLRAKAFDRPGDGYRFDVPPVRELGTVELGSPVTFSAGENGRGRSTVREAIAAAGSTAVGGATDGTPVAARRDAAHLTHSRAKRTGRSFFLRAEEFGHVPGRTTGLVENGRDRGRVRIRQVGRPGFRSVRVRPPRSPIGHRPPDRRAPRPDSGRRGTAERVWEWGTATRSS